MDTVLKGKKILVTGGAGFIGSHLVDRLAQDNTVTVLDNLTHGSPDYLAGSKDLIEFVKGDILDKALVAKLVGKAEYVFHLAALVSVIQSLAQPEEYLKVNLHGTYTLLEACRNSKIQRFIYSSSAAVFGDSEYLPVDEKHPLNPRSPYAASKLAAEKLALAYYHSFGVPVTALRYFNAYGPRQSTSAYANVISIFMRNLKAGQPLTIYGDGEQTRDLIYVKDIVAANVLAALNPAATGEVFNIATGKGVTVNTLSKAIQSASGLNGKIEHAAERPGEIRHSRAGVKKAGKILGFKPEVTLEQGLKQTWDSLK
jgi:UDP-glucose 4-epimerase